MKLAPGGLHLMLIDIKRPLRERDRVPLTLTLERADGSRFAVAIEAEVRSASGGNSHHH